MPLTFRSLLAAGLSLACIVPAAASPILTVRPMFPRDNVWNVAIDALPVDANSAAYVTTIGAAKTMHADFGTVYNGAPNGIPFIVVPGTQPGVAVTFDYADESDPGPYPLPPDAPIEGGPLSTGDRHLLVVDRDGGKLYELFAAYPNPDGSWHAGSGAIFDLNSNVLRPAGWTSADAAGLPMLPGLVRYEEVVAGEISHALRFTAPQTRNAFVWPARHKASSLSGTSYPPMGQRFRLKAGVDISSFGPNVQVILRALKKYGMFLADNGSSWFLSGAPDPRWDDNELHQLGLLAGSDFEAVDESALIIDPDSGRTSAAALSRIADEVQVLEFHREQNGYFLTIDANEIAALDSGQIPGWARTGEAFLAYSPDSAIAQNLSPVCRFFGRAEAGQQSHFFSAYTEECAAVARWLPNEWQLESSNAFVVALPDAGDGSCAAGSVPVYRLYNNDRAAVDHRYTTSRAIQAQMIAAGWLAEGSGPEAVAMCAPAP
ncbi:MAG: hypothetical protein ABI900_09630 [Betaproteobacteria bacterium]